MARHLEALLGQRGCALPPTKRVQQTTVDAAQQIEQCRELRINSLVFPFSR
jgi:hypothetical protein